jgi:hypothetical protein
VAASALRMNFFMGNLPLKHGAVAAASSIIWGPVVAGACRRGGEMVAVCRNPGGFVQVRAVATRAAPF